MRTCKKCGLVSRRLTAAYKYQISIIEQIEKSTCKTRIIKKKTSK